MHCGFEEAGEGLKLTPQHFGSPQELKLRFSSESCFPAISRLNTASMPWAADHSEVQQAARTALLCHELLALASPGKGKGYAAEPGPWSRDEMGVVSQHSCFVLLHSLLVCISLACSVLLGSGFPLISPGQRRGSSSKQPEEVFPGLLHTLQRAGTVRQSLGAKPRQKEEKHQSF